MSRLMTVLIAPQHWGLGHVTRTIPVIRYFVERGHKVILASSLAGSDLLRREFPQLEVCELPDYGILYPSKNMYWNMAYQLLQMHKAIFKEKKVIKDICKKYKIDLVISDARLGAAQRNIRSVIITHHLHFPLPLKLFEWCADTWMRFFYMQFNEIWIPDYEFPPYLSGVLAHQFKSKKHYFIGALSRFQKLNLPIQYDLCFMLSGPEPQRTRLEEKIVAQLKDLDFKTAILIRGKNGIPKLPAMDRLEVIDLATSGQLNEIMCASRIIICRSGYSTLLDLSVIQKRALLIPTPGQPEQEYLGRTLHSNGIFYNVDQDQLDLKKHIPLALQCPGYQEFSDNRGLYDILDYRLKNLSELK